MATFPRTEAKIAQLSRDVIAGLKTNPDLFPQLPVPADELEAAYEAYIAAVLAVQEAEALATQRYTQKAEALKALVDVLKTDLRHAEITARDDDHLRFIGWGGRRPRTKLGAPGQVLGLEIVEEGPDWIALRWKKPPDGGKVAAYKVLVSRGPAGSVQEAGMTVHRKLTLTNQPRGVDLTYRVKAVNRAGEGLESGIVSAVL